MAERPRRPWVYFGVVWALALAAYGPALTGPFVYDDTIQRYAKPAEAAQPLIFWISGLRPMLYLSFWLNHLAFGDRPLGYHLVNIAIHVLNTALVFLVVRKLLILYRTSAAGWKQDLLTAFAAGVFLLHPIQTESVAYIASRSETLCAFFILAALALFLYRLPGRLSWPASAAVLLLLAAASASKEQAVVLIPVLLLTDLYWNTDFSLADLRRNWRLYLPLAVCGLMAGIAVWRIVAQSPSAGFRLHEFTWAQYFFTECRVFFTYIRLLILPVGQTLRPNVPISRTILDHGSIFGLIGIAVILSAAIYFRRRYRLASFGILLFVVLLAPTSSVVPLLDPQVEHRLYLPALALILVLLEFLLRARMPQPRLAALCVSIAVILGGLCYARSRIWGDEVLLWKDALVKAPDSPIPYYNVAIAYINQRRCGEAEDFLHQVPARFDRDIPMMTLRGRTEECLAKFEDAVHVLAAAARLLPRASLYIRIGIIRTRQGKLPEALGAFERAIELDPSSKAAYVLRGEWYESADRLAAAAGDFQRALQLAPDDGALRQHLEKLEQRLRSSGGLAQTEAAGLTALRP